MQLDEYDELVWLEAIIKAASERRDILKGNCKDRLLEAYEEEGTTQKRSKLFGKEASVMSVTFSKPKEPREVVEWNLADDELFAEWLEDNSGAAFQFAMLHATDLAAWWFDGNGEVAEGIARVPYMTEGEPERVSGVRLSVKPDKVFEKLGVSFEDGIRGLLPGDAA